VHRSDLPSAGAGHLGRTPGNLLDGQKLTAERLVGRPLKHRERDETADVDDRPLGARFAEEVRRSMTLSASMPGRPQRAAAEERTTSGPDHEEATPGDSVLDGVLRQSQLRKLSGREHAVLGPREAVEVDHARPGW
jgi:hypothetical protein